MKENKNPTVQKEGGIRKGLDNWSKRYPHIQRNVSTHLVDAERAEKGHVVEVSFVEQVGARQIHIQRIFTNLNVAPHVHPQ